MEATKQARPQLQCVYGRRQMGSGNGKRGLLFTLLSVMYPVELPHSAIPLGYYPLTLRQKRVCFLLHTTSSQSQYFGLTIMSSDATHSQGLTISTARSTDSGAAQCGDAKYGAIVFFEVRLLNEMQRLAL
jgi:hypothetical protein